MSSHTHLNERCFLLTAQITKQDGESRLNVLFHLKGTRSRCHTFQQLTVFQRDRNKICTKHTAVTGLYIDSLHPSLFITLFTSKSFVLGVKTNVNRSRLKQAKAIEQLATNSITVEHTNSITFQQLTVFQRDRNKFTQSIQL